MKRRQRVPCWHPGVLLIWLSAMAVMVILVSSCGQGGETPRTQAKAKKHILTLGIREGRQLVTEYSGTGRNNMTRYQRRDEDGPFEVSFAGMHLPPGVWYTQQTTQYNDAYVTGFLQPLDANWNYFSCRMQVDSQVPIDIVFTGILSTNTANTNGEDTVFSLPAGQTNLNFAGKLVSLLEKPKSQNTK